MAKGVPVGVGDFMGDGDDPFSPAAGVVATAGGPAMLWVVSVATGCVEAPVEPPLLVSRRRIFGLGVTDPGLITKRFTEDAAYASGVIMGRPPVPIVLNGDVDVVPVGETAGPKPRGRIFAAERGEGR